MNLETTINKKLSSTDEPPNMQCKGEAKLYGPMIFDSGNQVSFDMQLVKLQSHDEFSEIWLFPGIEIKTSTETCTIIHCEIKH